MPSHSRAAHPRYKACRNLALMELAVNCRRLEPAFHLDLLQYHGAAVGMTDQLDQNRPLQVAWIAILSRGSVFETDLTSICIFF